MAYGRPKQQTSRLASILTMSAVLGGFVAFAGLITWMAPTYTIDLRRTQVGEAVTQVEAVVVRHILFVVPWQTQTAAGITGVHTERYRPEPSSNVNSDRADHPTATPEEVGTLYLRTADGDAEILVAPEQLTDVARTVREFLESRDDRLRVTVVSNWVFGVVAPGVILAIAGLLLLGMTWDLVVAPLRRLMMVRR